MNIIYLHQYFSTPQGSSGLRSYEFARALIKKGHKVTVVCGSYDGSRTGLEDREFVKGKRSGIADGIHIIELALPYSNLHSFVQRGMVFLKYAFAAIREACRKEYDIVFATSTPLTAAIPGIVAHLFARKKFVFEVRDLWPELPKAMGVIKNPLVLLLMGLLERTAYRCSTRIIGLSPGIVSGIVKHGISSSHVALIPNACDERLFNPSKRTHATLPGLKNKDFVAIYSGTVGIANGVDAVLDAASRLKSIGRSDIKVLIIGRGNRREQLRQRAEREKLDNCIFSDPVSKNEIAVIVASSHVGLMVLANVPEFYFGTSPNKFFDYIASGLPVVNNYPGWLAGMIKEYNCGVVVRPGDAEEFAQALCTMADKYQLRRKMADNALALSKRFLRSEMAERFCATLEEAAG